jgi:hypothetical protein
VQRKEPCIKAISVVQLVTPPNLSVSSFRSPSNQFLSDAFPAARFFGHQGLNKIRTRSRAHERHRIRATRPFEKSLAQRSFPHVLRFVNASKNVNYSRRRLVIQFGRNRPGTVVIVDSV